jgi:hypothetical protein
MTDDSASIDPAAALEKARRETRAAFENRALMYRAIHEELEGDVGSERATAIMKSAIHRRGLAVGRKYREAADAGDLRLVGCIFCEDSPSDGELFSPGIESWDGETIVLRMTTCPLVDAWRAAGLADADVDLMCEIAAAVDEGTFEGAGLDLTFRDRLGIPGSAHCLLELRVPERG